MVRLCLTINNDPKRHKSRLFIKNAHLGGEADPSAPIAMSNRFQYRNIRIIRFFSPAAHLDRNLVLCQFSLESHDPIPVGVFPFLVGKAN